MAAREIIEGPKKVFFRPDFAFFGRTTGLYPLQKPSAWTKKRLFPPLLATPPATSLLFNKMKVLLLF